MLEPFADPRVGAVQGRYVASGSSSLFSRVMALDLEQRYAPAAGRPSITSAPATPPIASARWTAVGLLNEELGYGYDNDLSYRLGAAGYRLIFCRDARSRHRWREGITGYLTQQYGFGYGRLDVVAAHPGRVAGDDVSPALMMAHPVVTAMALICIVGALVRRRAATRPLLTRWPLLAGASSSSARWPACARGAASRTRPRSAFRPVHVARERGVGGRDRRLGLAAPVWRRRASPAASMKPRPVTE